MRWIREKAPAEDAGRRTDLWRPKVILPTGATLARDARGAWVVLLPNDWTARYFEEENPVFEVLPLPPVAVRA